MGPGMLSTGTMTPEITMTGKMMKKPSRSACWRLPATVPTRSPSPRLLKRKRAGSEKKSGRLPRSGTANHQGTQSARASEARLPTKVGITLASMSCHDAKGITSSCSIVPASFSQASPAAGRMTAILITASVSIETTSKSTVRSAGLYQARRRHRDMGHIVRDRVGADPDLHGDRPDHEHDERLATEELDELLPDQRGQRPHGSPDLLPEEERGGRPERRPAREEDGGLRPQAPEPDPPAGGPAGDLQEVGSREEMRVPLEGRRHARDREEEAGEEECRHQREHDREQQRHHLGAGHGGDQEADPHRAQDVDEGEAKEQGEAASDRRAEPEAGGDG